MLTTDEVSRSHATSARSVPVIRAPRLEDGAALWRIARDSGSLDLNSSYAYLMLARDFAETSRVVEIDGTVVGYVVGYRRPDQPDRLFVWQVAVDADHRGLGLSRLLLETVVQDLRDSERPIRWLETTITDDNEASQGLFRGFARRQNAALVTSPLFTEEHFPDGHAGEPLYLIGPLDTSRD